MKMKDLIDDLREEQQVLDEIVARLTDEQWDLPTPSPRWSVSDQIAHLHYFDSTAASAIREPAQFGIATRRILEASKISDEAVDTLTLGGLRALAPGVRLQRWRQSRQQLLEAAATLGERDRVTWYGPSMGAKSFITARLMEVWAHGQDICDAVSASREPTDRLRHIAQLGYLTRGWAYVNRGLPAPSGDVRVELQAPSGATWTWGDVAAAAGDSVSGPALDFCLVVTQRRHADDTSLEVTGQNALDWMSKAQAFAGPPTDGRAKKADSSEDHESSAASTTVENPT